MSSELQEKEIRSGLTLSISNIALIFLMIVAFFFIGIGVYAYLSLEDARADIRVHNRDIAGEEIVEAVNNIVNIIDTSANNISVWDEVFQQLENPAYYSYWRQYRLLESGIIPDFVTDAEVFNRYGLVLAESTDSPFPSHIDTDDLDPYIDTSEGFHLIIYVPVKRSFDGAPVQGYIGYRLPFFETILQLHTFRYIDTASLTFIGDDDGKIKLDEAVNIIGFSLKESPEATMMMSLVKSTVLQLATIVGILCLFFYFLMVFILGKPLIEISEYIDSLIHRNPGSMKGGVHHLFPVSELEKIRTSLNKYQADLEKAQGDLDEKNKELWVLAHHDALTGVLNRRAFELQWKDSVNLLEQRRIGIGLILFDINHFKAINDTYGHHVGDEVLCDISACIQETLRRSEKLYRIGGDEFATVVIGSTTDDELNLGQRCIDAVQACDFTRLGIKETVRISCGVAHCQADEAERLNSLQRQADIAVYQAKRPGVHQPVLFIDEMADGTEALFSSWISEVVYEAVTSGTGIEMHYQPVVDNDTSRTAYYESLLRIRNDDELVPPSHIFPIINMRKMEVELDQTIIRHVMKDLENGLLPRGTGVSLNLSAESIAHKDVIDWLMPLTDFTQSYYIVIEVTETSLITQIGVAARSLTILRKLGFKVALDDFGSGYSSLRYLTSMPVDIIKFDNSLIQGMHDERLGKLVTEMAEMLVDLGYNLVAEGIETEILLDKVRKAGFDYSQGYLLGRPERDRNRIRQEKGEVVFLSKS
jgi:diguanylate cyclase (GGDEF)-like protein